jgi:hypothetical protein
MKQIDSSLEVLLLKPMLLELRLNGLATEAVDAKIRLNVLPPKQTLLKLRLKDLRFY